AGWTLAKATATGTMHIEAGIGCHDSVGGWVRSDDRGLVDAIGVVADGAGSALLPELGSRTAVAYVVDEARKARIEHFEGGREVASLAEVGNESESTSHTDPAVELVRRLFSGARKALEVTADEEGVKLRDLATTLMVAMVTDERFVVAEIGDGVVAVRSSDGTISSMISPQRGEFANEATFITSGAELPHLELASRPVCEVNAFGLSSDGLRLLITSNSLEGSPYPPFFNDVFSAVVSGTTDEQIAGFLERAADRTGDDKSLVIGVRRAP
ncbi:MAG TPA: PP2C family serine/threonine-protein phosphatase, partial [Acidimicrobiales bacterium]|nr:PP2C family serine/threonine-protein phosphatase [Acidimicrobiales bacterium]